jgi:hypothetical protein
LVTDPQEESMTADKIMGRILFICLFLVFMGQIIARYDS